MNINIKTHSLIYTVAPSGSGKSHFCNEVLIKQIKEKYPLLNVQYISSDAIRRELVGNLDFHDVKMIESSQSAFKLLETKLEAVLKYDIRAEIVIVDTTGLAQYFRDYLDKMAKDNHYNLVPIVFDYKDSKEYYTQNESDIVTTKHLKKFRLETLSKLPVKKYPNKVVIKSKEESNFYNITVNDYDKYLSHFLPTENNYVVVSDIHGELDSFIEIIEKQNNTTVNSGKIESDKIFIVQDFVDKGSQILETIEFIYNNWLDGKIVVLKGNHENFIQKALMGKIPDFQKSWLNGDLRELLDKQFGTYHLLSLEDNKEYKRMFLELIENSKEWYQHKYFFVNHAPCDSKYIGKIDNKSLSNMRNYMWTKVKDNQTDEEYSEELKNELDGFMNQYDNKSYKNIIWGHVALNHVYGVGKNYIIDTGCVSGGQLTSVDFDFNGKPYFKSVKSKKELEKYLPIINTIKKEVSFNDLDGKEVNRIRYMAKDKINFVMPTMSPSDKNLDDPLNKLESLVEGLNYYKDKGLDKVMLQKKYMGSNAQVYLFKDVEKCYTTSRNGYLVKNLDLTEAYIKLLERLSPYMDKHGYEMIIVSAELMPWSVLGKGLIENSFRNPFVGFSTEHELLKDNNFYEEYNKLKNHPLKDEYIKDSKNLSKKDLSNKYGNREHNILKSIVDIGDSIPDVSFEKEGIENFKLQLDLFGVDGEPYFLPFSILKGVRGDGSEDVMLNQSNEELYKIVSDDEYHIVDFNDKNYETKALDFYERICLVEGMEGVVIKPMIMDIKDVLPFMKVRNYKYLTLTYGYDYTKPSKFKKLLSRKKINGKKRASHKQWAIAKNMLLTPYNEITFENGEYVQTCINMVIEERFSEKIDPRL